MICNICGNNEFQDFNTRKGIACTKCRSLERTRLMWLYIEEENIDPTFKILHMAPELGLYARIRSLVENNNYTVADFEPKRYSFAKKCKHIDLCDLDSWPSNEYDLIIHNHVLEHARCNIAYILYHLHRMLKPSGLHIFSIPFLHGEYDESLADIGNDERKRRFGQSDHLRRFGINDIHKHIGSIVDIPKEYDAAKHFGEDILIKYNIPRSQWRGFSGSTILKLNKNSYKLANLDRSR